MSITEKMLMVIGMRIAAPIGFNMISLKGDHFQKETILYAVYVHLRYTVPFRPFETLTAERDVRVDHVERNKRLVKHPQLVAACVHSMKRYTLKSWCMEGTYNRMR